MMRCIVILLFACIQVCYAQKQQHILKYLESDPEVPHIEIQIPDFSTDSLNIPKLHIDMKYKTMADISYVRQSRDVKDTFYICTYIADDEISYSEHACAPGDVNACGIMLTRTGNFTIRFRRGSEMRYYKLAVTN